MFDDDQRDAEPLDDHVEVERLSGSTGLRLESQHRRPN